jgi:hypothetical protein
MGTVSDKGSVDSALCRDSVVGMLQVLQNHDHPAPAWNIVDALEVLIDAGQFRVARGLASSISELVNGDGRERLFDGYVVLCDLMERDSQRRTLPTG